MCSPISPKFMLAVCVCVIAMKDITDMKEDRKQILGYLEPKFEPPYIPVQTCPSGFEVVHT